MKTTTENTKLTALAQFLDCDPEELRLEKYDHYGLEVYSLGRQEYAIGDDGEAQSAAYANIKESLWAFNASFLASFCDLPECVFEALLPKYESANDAVLSLVEKSGKFEDFADEAISADGRGHFLSGYDGEENEQDGLFIYRLN